MERRITYQNKLTSGEPLPLTKEKWDELIDSPEVKNICARIAALDVNAPDYNDKKQSLKKRLPVIMPHASSFKNGRRVSADAVPSGLAMLDVDHVEEPHAWFEALAAAKVGARVCPSATQNVATEQSSRSVPLAEAGCRASEWLREQGICLIAITASGKGLRVIGERLRVRQGIAPTERFALIKAQPASALPTTTIQVASGTPELESIEEAQMRMAEVLGIKEYDAVTKDLARASYVVPREYVLWCDEAGLLYQTADADRVQTATLTEHRPLALPPYTGGKNTAEGDAPTGSHADDGRKYTPEGEIANTPEAEPASDAGVMNGELCYRGIPYKEIVEQLLIATGNGGGAVQGERNTVYFMLANYMRYICDFSAEVLLRVLPDFGLGESERRQAINSAIGRPRKSQMPMVLQGAIAVCERDHAHIDTSNMLSSTDLPLPELPRLLRIICRRLPAEYRPAMVIASLPVLGTLATHIRFEYLDRQEQSLSFFACITAPAASGKSFIRKPLDLLLTPINEQDAIEREKEQAYKEKLRASKNSKNQPEDPHACPRNNGVSISIAKLLQLLTYAEGKHLIGIGEEMDTLVKTERAGAWSQKSDIYRLAFDNAEYGQAYMSEASFNAHVKVYYNLLLTGTPNSLRRFFKDLENGLLTRVAFAQLPDTSFAEIPIFAPYSEAEKAEIIRWARQLDAERGTISCAQVGTIISEWLEKKRQQAIDADSHAMDTLRRRAAVMGFRAGMLCYLLENRKYTKTVGAFAEWVAEYIFRNQMELWGNQMEQDIKGTIDEQTERGAAASLLSLLPDEFTAADLIKLRARKGQSVKASAISMVINRWRANRRIEKLNETTWKKL